MLKIHLLTFPDVMTIQFLFHSFVLLIAATNNIVRNIV